jgi:hypothetical protein
MAITSLETNIAVARIADVAFKVSGGSQTDLAEATDISATVDWASAEGEGEGKIVAVSTKMRKATITFGTLNLSTTNLALLTGATAPSLGATTTPNFVQTTNFTTADVCPYFAFGVKSTDITGLGTLDATEALPADCIIIFPKCKVTQVADILPPVDGFATVKLTATAMGDGSNILFKIVQNQTTAGISL